MTWQDAKAQGKQWVASIMARNPCPKKGDMVGLTDYEDEATYVFLKSEDRWTLTFHRMVNKAVVREFRKLGITAATVIIRLPEYWSWLESNQLTDSPDQRAKFINERI